MRFGQFYLSESLKLPDVWYHGTKTDFDKFDLNYVFTKKSIAKYGPGFYLTSNKKDAEMFIYMRANDGFLKTVKLSNSGNIKKSTDKISNTIIKTLIDNSPEKEIVLSNWDENPNKALAELTNYIKTNSKNLEQLIINIWNECYVGYEKELCNNLVNLNIDGIIVNLDSSDWLICYNPKILKISYTEKY